MRSPISVSLENVLCGWTALTLLCVAAQDFGYGPQHGPEFWSDTIRCSGKYQVGVNFGKLKVKDKSYPELEYINFDINPRAVHLTNNGYTVLVTMTFDKGSEPRISGGPLPSKAGYQFEQFHFRWSDNTTVFNRNHTRNIEDPPESPAELHIVMRGREYPDFESAVGHNNGIIVLSFFLMIQEQNNTFYEEFVELLPSISQKDNSVDLQQPLPLMRFLPSNPKYYYTYGGSLTTAPCIEQVVWIDYFDSIGLSELQFDNFRELIVNDDHLKYSVRRNQLEGDRVVYTNLLSNVGMGRQPYPIGNAESFYADSGIRLKGLAVPLVLAAWLFRLLLLKGNLLVAFN